jgi:hypothetical protein
MDLNGFVSATQLISNAITAMKYVREVSDGSDDLELKSRMNDFSATLLDLTGRIMALDQETRELKAELAVRDDIDGPVDPHGYFFFKNKPDQPLCPRCLQSDLGKPVFLGPLLRHKGGKLRRCPVCKYGMYEEPPTTGPAIAIGESMSSRLRGYL